VGLSCGAEKIMQNTHKAYSGFSLLEVTVVMGVVLVMTGALVPSVMTGIQNYRISASTQEIASQIQSARQRALRNNAMCSFLILSATGQFGIDVNGDGNLSAGTQDVLLSLDSNVSFANLGTPPAGITGESTLSAGSKTGIGFTPRGTLTAVSTSGTPDYSPANLPAGGFAIYLANTRNRFAAITVSPTGRVRTWYSSTGTVWHR
jgi:Tfp pilus assembly protein FimT